MKRLFLGFALLWVFCGSAFAQVHRSEAAVKAILEDNTRAANNHNSYEFFPVSDTPAPKGYKPFYISHYGRHGSRSAWGGDAYKYVIGILEQGQAAGLLTPGGDSLLVAARKVLEAYNGMDGRLTPRGVREHARIAERMYKRYPEVFKGAKRIRAVSSYVPRCIVSMNSFTNSLIRLNPKLDISLDTGERIMEYISPNDEGAREITRQAYEKAIAALADLPDDTLGVMTTVFTDPVAAREFVHSPRILTECIFYTADIAEDFDIEENLFRFLPFDAIYLRWARKNVSLYTGQCNSVEGGAGRCAIAKPSADDIVAKADEAIASGDCAADLRFGHDYPLLGLVSYLGIEGVGDRIPAEEICDRWLGFWEIPMASNLQMIFYRNKKGDVLVKFLYQEKERLLRGLEPVTGPYYRWEDVKSNLEGYKR
ncbi:MAG: hypothetical protein IKS71_00840 [Bacteroidales bacterium]|nr:hypothetical protein [Bacteroidales bacterium]